MGTPASIGFNPPPTGNGGKGWRQLQGRSCLQFDVRFRKGLRLVHDRAGCDAKLGGSARTTRPAAAWMPARRVPE